MAAAKSTSAGSESAGLNRYVRSLREQSGETLASPGVTGRASGRSAAMMLEQLGDMAAEVATVDHAAVPALLAALAAIQTVLAGRLLARPAATTQSPHDRLLKAPEAAQRLGCSVDYLYDHADRLGFAKRQGRSVRFSEAGIAAYIAGRNGRT